MLHRGTNLERYERATATKTEAWRYGIARVLEPPFVNSGIVALHGDLMAPELLRSMVQEALPHPKDSSCEQTIIASAVKLNGELFPEKLSLVEFDDVRRFRSRDPWSEGYCSRHYVNWMRHMLYRDALKLHLRRGRLDTRHPGQ